MQEKVDIHRQVDAWKKQIDISKELGMAPSTVATILKDRQKITELHRGSQAALLAWFTDAHLQDVPVSGPMLLEKARQFADALDVTSFKASAVWLHRFRQRNGITWQVVSGEEKTEDAAGAAEWRNDKFR